MTTQDPSKLEKHDLKRVKIGLIHSLTGTMALSERSLLDAERLAIDEINAQGGLLGCRIDPMIVDGASVPETFAQQARVALSSGVDTLFGCWTSSSRKAVKPLVEASDGLLWYPVQYEGLEESTHICYTGSCLNQQITPAVQWILENVGSRVFLLGSDYVFPRTANQLIRSLVEHQGGSIAGEHYAELGSRDFAAAISQVRQERPSAVFNTLNGDSNTWFYHQYRAAGILAAKIPIMAVSVGETELAPIADVAQGHLACWSYFQSLESVENQRFVARFKGRYGTDRVCSDPMVMAYSQIYLWKQAVTLAGSFAPGEVRRCLPGCSYESPAGPITIHANHHVGKHAYVGRLAADGQFEIVWRSEQPIEPLPWLGLEGLEFPAKALVKRSMAAFTEVTYASSILEREVRERGRLEEALRRSNDELESQVRERTKELVGLVTNLQIEITEHKRVEEALQESEERYRQMVESAHDWVWEVDDQARYIFASSKVLELLGYEPEEVLGKTPFDLMPPDEAERVVGLFAPIGAARKPFRDLPNTSLHKDGHLVFLETSGVPIIDSSGEYRGYRGMDRDVTERKQAEELLKDEISRRRVLVEQSSDGIVVLDQWGKVYEANEQYARLLGYSVEEVNELHVWDWDTQFTKEQLLEMLGAVDSRGDHFETHHRRKDGTLCEVEISTNGAVYSGKKLIFCVCRDITERKQVEQALKQRESLLREAQVLASLGSYELDILAGSWTCSDMLDTLFGIDKAYERSVEGWLALVHPDDQAMMSDYFGGEVLGRGRAFNKEYRVVRHNDGAERWAHGLGRLEFDDRGHPVKMLGTIQDITARKQAEEVLREREEQLRQSQKMEAVGQLAGGIAHDFNNLLAAILGYSDMILTSGASSLDEVRSDIEEIKRAGERATALTKQILAFSRRQALRPTVVSLNGVLEQMEPLLRRTLGEDIELLSLKDPDLGSVEADVHQFEQVIMNLALNARDAMSPGGRLTLETTNVELDEEYCRTHPEATPGSYVMLSVSDTGVGMDPETMDHAFEPFFTTKAFGQGTGLGLATVYGVVIQSHGSISVESEPGEGTSFKVYLPRSVQSHIPEETIVPPHEPATGSETVTVVEDEAALRALIERILGEAGYTTLAYGSATEALEALEQGQYSIDLLLTDVMLPGPLQGHDLARAVLAARPDLPVLFMSGYPRDALVHASRLDDGVNLLEKPFTPEALVRVVRQVLDQSR